MKLIGKGIITIISAMFLMSCHETTVAVDKVQDVRLEPQKDLGERVVSIYTGAIPDSTFCALSIYSYRHSGDGVYALQLMKNGKLTSLIGKRQTWRGEDDATLWVCADDCGNPRHIFMASQGNDTIYWEPNDTANTRDYPLILANTSTF